MRSAERGFRRVDERVGVLCHDDEGETVPAVVFYVEPDCYDRLKDELSEIVRRYEDFDVIPDAYFLGQRLLRANLLLNDVEEQVQAFRLALSDRAEIATLVVVPKKASAAHLPSFADEESGKPHQQVTLARLDDLIAEGALDPRAIGLLWIDAEAHEAHVLRGARQTLAHGFPVVVELSPMLESTGDLGAVVALLRDHFTRFLDLRDEKATVTTGDHLDALIETIKTRRRVTDLLAFNKRP